MRRTIRRSELRQIVPVADTTIYEMEQRGKFPATVLSHAALRGLGPCRSRSVDRERRLDRTQPYQTCSCPGCEATQDQTGQTVASGTTNCMGGG